MSSSGKEPKLEELIATIWDQVVKTVNKLTDTHEKYGYVRFKEGMNPSIDVVVKAFNLIEDALKILMESEQLSVDETRQAINCRQCILHTKGLALALESDNEDEYHRVIDLLCKQALV